MKTLRLIGYILVVAVLATTMPSCDEEGDPQGPIDLNEEQTASVEMRGKWGQASEPDLPFGTTEGVLNDLILEFRTGDDYYPADFSASGADYFFGTDGEGSWEWIDDTYTTIALSNVDPITTIQIIKRATNIRVTFIYEGEDGGRVSGLGEYSVTLNKIAP